jgi:hypothetical protein
VLLAVRGRIATGKKSDGNVPPRSGIYYELPHQLFKHRELEILIEHDRDLEVATGRRVSR